MDTGLVKSRSSSDFVVQPDVQGAGYGYTVCLEAEGQVEGFAVIESEGSAALRIDIPDQISTRNGGICRAEGRTAIDIDAGGSRNIGEAGEISQSGCNHDAGNGIAGVVLNTYRIGFCFTFIDCAVTRDADDLGGKTQRKDTYKGY